MVPDLFVCVKQATVLKEPVRFTPEARDIAADCRYWRANEADRFALEAALRARECGAVGTVTCVTAGPAAADEALYYALAAGADRAVRLPVPAALLFEPSVVGTLLGTAIRYLGGRLVFAAQRSNDGESGLVPAYLAHVLRGAYLSNVSDFRLDPAGIEIRRRIERGHRQVWRASLPAVVAFDPGGTVPRYVAVAAIALARRREIEQLTPQALGTVLSQLPRPARLERLMPARVRSKKLQAPPSNQSAAERMRAITTGGTTNKKATFLEGAPHEVAVAVTDYLRQHRLLKRPDA